jgi:hypothetical protein
MPLREDDVENWRADLSTRARRANADGLQACGGESPVAFMPSRRRALFSAGGHTGDSEDALGNLSKRPHPEQLVRA